jgi:vacuolar protein sorting-associated protein 35
VVIQVFPDEFHLNTLDQFLSAVARLHPMVNVKNIVIGLMDRLSAYAARDTAPDSPEERQAKEAENLIKLLNNLTIAKETVVPPSEPHQNGDGEPTGRDESSTTASVASTDPQYTPSETSTTVTQYTPSETSTAVTQKDKIPEDVHLFDIFYEQVMSLTKLHQRLQVWDVMALLVSLTNLAL